MRATCLILPLTIFTLLSFKQEEKIVYTINRGSIHFKSEAVLEIIKASSTALRGYIDCNKKDFAFAVNISSFDGFNAALQREHFNEKYMESAVYPTASFKGKILDEVEWNHNGVYPIRAKGVLSIHGVEQERTIKVMLTIKNEMLTADSEFSVLLQDHNIKVPKVVHEKIATDIQVTVNAEMQRK